MGSGCSKNQHVTEFSPKKSSTAVSHQSQQIKDPIIAQTSSSDPRPSPSQSRRPPVAKVKLSSIKHYPECVQDLLLGNVTEKLEVHHETVAVYHIATCTKDSLVERSWLFKNVYPELRSHCISVGYTMSIMDVCSLENNGRSMIELWSDHLKTVEKMCGGMLLIPIFFLNDKITSDITAVYKKLSSYDNTAPIFVNRTFSDVESYEEDFFDCNSDGSLNPESRSSIQQLLQGNKDRTVNLSVRWKKGGIDLSVSEHAQYIKELGRQLLECAKDEIDQLSKKVSSLPINRPIIGVSKQLLDEMQSNIFKCQQTNATFEGYLFKDQLNDIISCDTDRPLVVHGEDDISCSVISAAYAVHAAKNNFACVIRYIPPLANGLPARDLLQSIGQQLCLLCNVSPCYAYQEIDDYVDIFNDLLSKMGAMQNLVVIIDGLSGLFGQIEWLPKSLPKKVKLVITTTDDLSKIKVICPDAVYFELKKDPNALQTFIKEKPHFTVEQKLKITDAVGKCPLPSTMCLAMAIARLPDTNYSLAGKTLPEQLQYLMEQLECHYNREAVAMTLCCLTAANCGLKVSEICDILHYVDSNITHPSYFTIILNVFATVAPLLFFNIAQGEVILHATGPLRQAVESRYTAEEIDLIAVKTAEYFSKHGINSRVLVTQVMLAVSNGGSNEETFLKYHWLSQTLQTCGVKSMLHALVAANAKKETKSLKELKDVLEQYTCALTADSQLLPAVLQLYCAAHDSCSEGILSLVKACPQEPSSFHLTSQQMSLLGKKSKIPITGQSQSGSPNGIYRLRKDKRHVLVINKSKQEVYVYDPYKAEVVCKIQGVNEPKNVCMIDDNRAVILCVRELMVYNLKNGELESKMKGALNLQHPYFGVQDDGHVVSLSRNRMYVNIMEIKTGDMAATFKVGEDRFLNSLSVSQNGKICVCGDEVQKPFPLLVWDLPNRKLIYDLRIPGHEFITNMSAITNDGRFVVCVCKEVDDPYPNFLIVYDLDTGQLYKKWQPQFETSAVAISSEGQCVVNALADGSIIVWDLISGVARHTLPGHSMAVRNLVLDNAGERCVSWDSTGCDVTLKLWHLKKGLCLGRFGCGQPITCCEISADGSMVLIGLAQVDEVIALRVTTNGQLEPEPKL